MHTAGDYIQITFSANASKDFQDLIVDSRTESVIWKHGDAISKVSAMPADSEGYVLPGIIAGEIVLAYRKALRENYRPLQTGAYAIHFEPFPSAV